MTEETFVKVFDKTISALPCTDGMFEWAMERIPYLYEQEIKLFEEISTCKTEHQLAMTLVNYQRIISLLEEQYRDNRFQQKRRD